MAIVFGTRLKRYTRGYVPGWNPLKGQPSWMLVTDVCKNWHIYLIDLGRGETVGVEVVPVDGPELPVGQNFCDISQLYEEPVGDPLDMLLSGSAEARETTEALMAEELAARTSKAIDSPRLGVVLSRFDSVLYASEVIAERSSDESITAVIGLIMFVSMFATAILFYMGLDWAWLALAISVISIVLMVWRTTVGLAKSRWKAVSKPLLHSLEDLGVDSDELDSICSETTFHHRGLKSMTRFAIRDLGRLEHRRSV